MSDRKKIERSVALRDIEQVLDFVSEVAEDEAKRVHGQPELAGMVMQLQGVSPEGLDLDALPNSVIEELEEIVVRVLVRLPNARFLGWEIKVVLGVTENYVARQVRDAARATFTDAIYLQTHHAVAAH